VNRIQKKDKNVWVRRFHTNQAGKRYESLTAFGTTPEGKPIILADHHRFAVISEIMFWLAGEYLIRGWAVGLKGNGYLRAVEDKSNKILINWKATYDHCRMHDLPVKRENMVFYQNELFRSIRWMHNMDGIYYEFNTSASCRHATGLRERFSRALTLTPELSSYYLKKN
jgi:hypothetical protein